MVIALALILLSGLIKNTRIRNYLLVGWVVYVAVYVLLSKFTDLCFACAFDKLKMKVTDCGCFGDFMHLEPNQSFFKDLILLFLILIIFFGRHHIKPWFSRKFGWKFMSVISILSAGFGIFCYLHLPVWDFLPYKVGNNIKEIMTYVPPGMRASDSIQMSYVMHKGKDSVEVPFIAPYKEYMDKSKAGWTVGRRLDKVIVQGYKNPIHDFVITNSRTGMEMRDTFLNHEGYQLMWVVPYIDKGYQGANKEIAEIYAWAKGKKFRFWALSSSGNDAVEAWAKTNKIEFPFYTSDQKTLITIARYKPTLY
jgi:triosephosphate isomerase